MMDTHFGALNGALDYDDEGLPGTAVTLGPVIQLALRTDLRRVLAGCPLEQSGARENLRSICAHARRHHIRAEQLLILIKETCATLPEARELLSTPRRAGTIEQLISMTVDEYYGPADLRGPPRT